MAEFVEERNTDRCIKSAGHSGRHGYGKSGRSLHDDRCSHIRGMRRLDQQKNRDSRGRYHDGPRCESCQKPTGFDYFSDHRLDTTPEWAGMGLVLCKKCAEKIAKLPDDEALAAVSILFKPISKESELP